MPMTIETNARAAMNQGSQGARMPEIDQLKDELRWGIANNEDRPRTEAALRWALEALEEMEEVKT